MSYTLFYAPGVASLAVHWMLVELGVEFQATRIDLLAGEQRSSAYMQLNPLGRIPTLLVDGQPYTESAALLMILAERHPEAALSPALGDARRDKWLETMVYLTNNLSSAMRDLLYADKDGSASDAGAVRRLALRRIEGGWDHLNHILGDNRPYLLGDAVTTADFLATMLMRWARNMPRPATSWDHIGPYVARMRSRPAFLEVCRREGLTDWLNG
jgi:glutathione S-transferase